MRKRSEAKKAKASAAERTQEIAFLDDDAKVVCTECTEETVVKDCSRRGDGTLECPACGMTIEGVGAKPPAEKAPPAAADDNEDNDAAHERAQEERFAAEQSPTPKEFPVPIPPADAPVADTKKKQESGGLAGYCGQCGAAWSWHNGNPWINCGHMTAERVDHPSKAAKWKPPAGHAQPPHVAPVVREMTKIGGEQPHVAGIVVEGSNVRVTWGEAKFPGHLMGVDYGGFNVGQFSMAMTVAEGGNRVAAARAMLSEARQIADIAFEEQKAWYESKLGRFEK